MLSTPQSRHDWGEYKQIAPGAYAALVGLGQAVSAAGLEQDLLELVKIRASQMNGCSFCVQHHLNLARSAGVPQTKLDLVAVWREAGVFSSREMAALAWTEDLTLVANHGGSDEQYALVCAEFSALEVVHLTTAIAHINAWNRIAGPLRFSPPIPIPAAPSAR